jgi:hypothetical protein
VGLTQGCVRPAPRRAPVYGTRVQTRRYNRPGETVHSIWGTQELYRAFSLVSGGTGG